MKASGCNGWTHVSTGSSAALPGGTVQAKIHLDGIISQPTIYLDDEVILQEGGNSSSILSDTFGRTG